MSASRPAVGDGRAIKQCRAGISQSCRRRRRTRCAPPTPPRRRPHHVTAPASPVGSRRCGPHRRSRGLLARSLNAGLRIRRLSVGRNPGPRPIAGVRAVQRGSKMRKPIERDSCNLPEAPRCGAGLAAIRPTILLHYSRLSEHT